MNPTIQSTIGSGSNESRPLRILSLDGGGVRGLVELLILEDIMMQVSLDSGLQGETSAIRPCEYFDFICGTSTGGLIAILLGRFGFTVKQAKDAYLKFSETVFGSRQPHIPLLSKFVARPLYDAERLKTSICDVVKGDEPFAGTADDMPRCRTAVLAVMAGAADSGSPRLFRSYSTATERADNCLVWEAARATSAAPTFFKEIEIDHINYLDAGLGYNNPTEQARLEAWRIWPGREIGCLLSLGSGLTSIPDIKDANLVRLAKACAQLVTSGNAVHEREFDRALQSDSRTQYFRFDVPDMKVSLDEWKEVEKMHAKTRAYMGSSSVRAARIQCARAISPGVHLQTLGPAVAPAAVTSTIFCPFFFTRFGMQSELSAAQFFDRFHGLIPYHEYMRAADLDDIVTAHSEPDDFVLTVQSHQRGQSSIWRSYYNGTEGNSQGALGDFKASVVVRPSTTLSSNSGLGLHFTGKFQAPPDDYTTIALVLHTYPRLRVSVIRPTDSVEFLYSIDLPTTFSEKTEFELRYTIMDGRASFYCEDFTLDYQFRAQRSAPGVAFGLLAVGPGTHAFRSFEVMLPAIS